MVSSVSSLGVASVSVLGADVPSHWVFGRGILLMDLTFLGEPMDADIKISSNSHKAASVTRMSEYLSLIGT